MITGAATGLGRVAAELFAQEGALVVVADVDDGDEAVTAIVAGGGEAAFVATDVTDDDSVAAAGGVHGRDVRRLARAVQQRRDLPRRRRRSDHHVRRNVVARTLDVNVTGIARCCRHGIPAMLGSGGGSIVNVASFVAHMGAATPQIAYTASKGAVVAMTREIAVIYGRQGIRANALCPGPVLTPLLAKFLSDDAKRQRRLVHIPMGRFGEPAEIAAAALFLASDESSFMTGQSLIVDGGITAAYTTPE